MSCEESGESQRHLYEQTLNYKFNIYVPPEEADLPSVKCLPMKKELRRAKPTIASDKSEHLRQLREALSELPMSSFPVEANVWNHADLSEFQLADPEPTMEETALFNRLKTEKIFKLPDFATRSADDHSVLKKYLYSLPASSMKPIAKEFKNRLNFLLDAEAGALGLNIVCLLILLSDDFKEGCVEFFLTEFFNQQINQANHKAMALLLREERFCSELLSGVLQHPESLAAIKGSEALIFEALKTVASDTRNAFIKRFLDYCSNEYSEKIDDNYILRVLASTASFAEPTEDPLLTELVQANLESFFIDYHMLSALYTVLLKKGSPTFAREVREFAFRDLYDVLRFPERSRLVRILFTVDETETCSAFLEAFIKQVGPSSPELKRILSCSELALCLSLSVSNALDFDYVELYRLSLSLHSIILTAPELFSEEHIRLLLKAIELSLEERS